MTVRGTLDHDAMTLRELLITGAEALGVILTAGQVSSVFMLLEELKKWNRRMNLTAIKGERDTIIKHVLDSLSYIKGFVPSQDSKLLDMGSGAGFPAIPIKIVCPHMAVTLVESVKKKASFLRHVVRTLPLSGIEVMDMRTEELPDFCHAAYDIVTARAFADMRKAITAGRGFLKPGGVIVLSRGPEENITDHALAEAGVTLNNKIELRLPHSDYKRVVWIFKKP